MGSIGCDPGSGGPPKPASRVRLLGGLPKIMGVYDCCALCSTFSCDCTDDDPCQQSLKPSKEARAALAQLAEASGLDPEGSRFESEGRYQPEDYARGYRVDNGWKVRVLYEVDGAANEAAVSFQADDEEAAEAYAEEIMKSGVWVLFAGDMGQDVKTLLPPSRIRRIEICAAVVESVDTQG